MMNSRYQLSAPIALGIIAVVSLATGMLLIHAIRTVDFTSVSSESALAASS